MTSRQLVCDTLTHRKVERAPRQLWTLPGVNMLRKDELDRMVKAFPSDFDRSPLKRGASYAKGTPAVRGTYWDSFGCQWQVAEDGVAGEVKQPMFEDFKAFDTYKLPWSMLRDSDTYDVADFCKQSDKFILQGSTIRLFERMQFMRGTENLFMDIAMEEPEFFRLRDMLHEFYMEDLHLLCSLPVDGISFMDDWGSQQSLLISPQSWRKLFKPLYKEYCDKIHASGKFVFFHSDGFIESIYPDLIEIGVDAVNSQLFCMDMEKLGRDYGGKITFWGEIDRQHILPFGTEQDVVAAVRRAAKALRADELRTGVIAQCEWSKIDPYENIQAVFETWNDVFMESGSVK